MTRAARRRKAVLSVLSQARTPVSAGTLAAQFSVSRQIIVSDIAMLRAQGTNILATPRGYVMETGTSACPQYTVACRHTPEQLLDELYTVVDCGCGVLDVIVEHPVYGQLLGQLQIFSRYDADMFAQKLKAENAAPLCRLTDDIHLHTLACPTPAQYERVLACLAAKGYLLRYE